MRNYEDLAVWRKAYAMTVTVYGTTRTFPREELYGLTSQIRRASTSIPANIAEGCGRQSDAELLRFFYIAMGSASELEVELRLAHDLSYLPESDYSLVKAQLTEVKKMLNAFIQKLNADTHKPSGR